MIQRGSHPENGKIKDFPSPGIGFQKKE